MLLAIDIGNSTISVGVFGETLAVRRMATHPLRDPGEYRDIFGELSRSGGMDKTPHGVVISSVVPGHTGAVAEAAREVSGVEPLLVGPDKAGGLRLDIKAPHTLGPDRIASAVAATAMLGPPVAVVDFGTATTVNFIGRGSGPGVYMGGAIMPGLKMMLGSLAGGTARLPMVELKEKAATSPLGRDTEGNILAGVIYGTAGAVERILKEVEGSGGGPYRVAVTGGGMGYVLPHLRRVDLAEPALTLMGLRIIHERGG